ncbi:MAG: coproporphyrinogen III oxidase family protein [Lentisphaeraceae bacterium]|nr:coproporphyrinogen III oxidase family protein [Lentisphaeraceae bacterium]
MSSSDVDQTTVGNYFVSNYPPYSFWTEECKQEALDAFDRPHVEGTPLGIYIHVPFCRKRCHFCYFRVYTDKEAKEIRAYVDNVVEELRTYSKKNFVGGRKPQFLYMGGGTPSYLSPSQLEHLRNEIHDILSWDDMEEVTFECEPSTVNPKKLQALKDFGVTRLSFGVENFTDEILSINGRAHLSKEIYRAYDFAKDVGFNQINIDLIAGMINETWENWELNIKKAIELDPDCVTIYQMEIPYNTTIYKKMKEEGKITAPVADWQTKRAWVNYAFEELAKHGYEVGSAYTMVKSKEKTKFVYRDSLWAGADLIGLGVSSFGHVNGTHYQNLHNFEPYMERVQSGELSVFRALTPTDEERLIREMILQLKKGEISISYFQDKFGVDITKKFDNQYKELTVKGLASISGDSVKLTRDALLQVDGLLPPFYLEKHQNVRYA